MATATAHKAVILARGLGSRMRKQVENTELTEAQAAAAAKGVKAMIDLDGRPFLDFVLQELVEAGFTDVCLVIGPEHDMIREYYDALDTERLTVSYAIQEEPLGTANAVLAAEEFAGSDRVLVINSDNFYPREALRQLREIDGSGLIGFTREAMVRESNIAPERLEAFALVTTKDDGTLDVIIEKPSRETIEQLGESALVSMNCWLCGPSIFDAARSIPKSARGEYEIPDAVQAAIAAGDPYQVVRADCGVLDLSNRGDISSVVAALGDREVRL